jgi:hypothetical protein
MKILKYGEGYPETVVCDHCKSELEYELKDIHMSTDHYMERSETFKWIKCPVCGGEIMIDVIIVTHEQLDKSKKRWWQR